MEGRQGPQMTRSGLVPAERGHGMTAQVGILMGSISDRKVVEPALGALRELGIPFEVRVISAHRTPQAAHDYAASAQERGLRVLIAAAGGAAHLAGVLASLTPLPVIGLPVASPSLGGLDSLLAIVQMPPGVPVATVGIGAAENAALLAAQILATADPDLGRRIVQHRRALAERVMNADRSLTEELAVP